MERGNRFCHECGAGILAGMKFCANCGENLLIQEPLEKTRSAYA